MQKTLKRSAVKILTAALAAEMCLSALPNPAVYARGLETEISFDSDVQGFSANGPASFAWDSAVDATENGGGSVRFSPKGSVNWLRKKINDISGFELGASYNVTFKIKGGQFTDGAQGFFRLEWNGSDSNDAYYAYSTSKSPVVDITDEWQEISFPWVYTNASTNMSFYFSGWQTGDYFYVDDITFEKLENSDEYFKYKEFDKLYSPNGELIIDGMLLDFHKTKTLLEVGEIEQIQALETDAKAGMTGDEVKTSFVSPDKLLYKSVNTDVVEVSLSGEMKAKSPGTTQIEVDFDGIVKKLNVTVVENKSEDGNFFIDEPCGQRTEITNPYDSEDSVYVVTGNGDWQAMAQFATEIPINEPSVTSLTLWDSGIQYTDSTKSNYEVPMGAYFKQGTAKNQSIISGTGSNKFNPKGIYYQWTGANASGFRTRGWHQWYFVVDYPEEDSGYNYDDGYMSLKAYFDGTMINSAPIYFQIANKDNKVMFYTQKDNLIKDAYSVKAGRIFEITDIEPAYGSIVDVNTSIDITLLNEIDEDSIDGNIELTDGKQSMAYKYETDGKILRIIPEYPLDYNKDYSLILKKGLKVKDSSTYVGGKIKEEFTYKFKTKQNTLSCENFKVNGNDVTFTLKNNTDSDVKAYCIVGLYDSAASKELKGEYEEIPANSKTDVTITTTEKAEQFSTELYIWNTDEGDEIISLGSGISNQNARNSLPQTTDEEFVTEYDAEKDIVTVSGIVSAKREKLPVIVRMYKKGGSGKFSELVRAEEVLTGENGAVSYSFKMGENDEKGRYVVLINCPFEKQIVKEIQYTTLEEINDSLKRIDSASLSALPSVFEAERDTLNLIEPEFDALQSKDFIYHCIFNGKTYADKDAGIFKNIYRQALRISNLIEAETGTAVEDIKNNHNNGYWKISENKETSTFKAFTETFDEKQQAGVLGKLKKSTGFDNNDTVFNTAVIAEDIKAQTTYNTMLAVMEKYSDTVNIDYKKFKALSAAGKENVWKAFTKEIDSFIDTDKIKQSIEAAAEAEYKKENSGSGNGGNGGNGGNNGSSGNKSSGVDLYPGVTQTDKPTPDWYIDSNASNTTNSVFSDIENIEWAKYSINKLYSLGAISGKSEGIFAPNDNMTREELCKIIASAFKLEHAENPQNVTFNDVEASAWYADYVAICTENGIINGIGDNLFGVGKTVTREEIATILVRAAEAAGKSLDYDYTIFPFPDDDEISDWAHDSVKILRECMIINGMEDDRFAPKENVTRAQGAKMIVGVLEFSY